MLSNNQSIQFTYESWVMFAMNWILQCDKFIQTIHTVAIFKGRVSCSFHLESEKVEYYLSDGQV